MGCVFPFLWEETVSQFIPDSWKSLCNPGGTQFKEFLLHGPGLPSAEVIDMSQHISVFPYDFDSCHPQRELGQEERRGWREKVGEREGEVIYVYSFHLFSPSPFLCLSLLLLEKSPNSKAKGIYQEIQNPFLPIHLPASPLLAGPSLGLTVWWDDTVLFWVSIFFRSHLTRTCFLFHVQGRKELGPVPATEVAAIFMNTTV